MRSSWLTASLLKSLTGRLMLGLVVLAMVYRGAIPLGYMLAPSSAHAGTLMVTLCVTGGGMVSMPVEVSASAGKDAEPDGLSALECPFAHAAAQVLLPDASAVAPMQAAANRVLSVAAHTPAPAMPAAGPPLGSRAPPSNLV